MDKVSIIVPVYNIEKYIERCVRSILEQTYTNIEIICVDDGSLDRSGEILDTLAKEDDRLIVFHKINGGLSSARNYGIERVTGEYILFVDGDDYIDSNCISTLINIASDKYDIVMFPYIREFSKKSLKTPLGISPEHPISGEVLFSYLIGPDDKNSFSPVKIDRLNTAWGKLYRTKCIQHVQFEDTREIGIEDAWFNMCVLSRQLINVFYTEQTWYHYEKENVSSILHQFKENADVKKWKLYKKIKGLIIENGNERLLPNLYRRIICEQFSILLNYCASNMKVIDISYCMKKISKEHNYRGLYKYYNKKQIKVYWRVFYALCYYQQFTLLVIFMRMVKSLRGISHE